MARETASVTVTLALEAVSRAHLRHIVIRTLPDLDTTDVEAAMRIVAGIARSRRIEPVCGDVLHRFAGPRFGRVQAVGRRARFGGQSGF
ncbi:hypothetical protein [Nocardia fluminea]|uniref:hypothetical protein n=1 Tax=Nocardia fluminea TaxID=134984 RepID=UPI003436052E